MDPRRGLDPETDASLVVVAVAAGVACAAAITCLIVLLIHLFN